MIGNIIGIDPGSISGAFAVLGDRVFVEDLPVVDRQVDPGALARMILEVGDPKIAVMEQVSAHPHQGVSSTFRFGVSVGLVLGVLATLNVPVTLVTPTKWKKHFSLGPDKEKSRALAIRYYPKVTGLSRRRDQGRAEALLMARWLQEKENGNGR